MAEEGCARHDGLDEAREHKGGRVDPEEQDAPRRKARRVDARHDAVGRRPEGRDDDEREEDAGEADGRRPEPCGVSVEPRRGGGERAAEQARRGAKKSVASRYAPDPSTSSSAPSEYVDDALKSRCIASKWANVDVTRRAYWRSCHRACAERPTADGATSRDRRRAKAPRLTSSSSSVVGRATSSSSADRGGGRPPMRVQPGFTPPRSAGAAAAAAARRAHAVGGAINIGDAALSTSSRSSAVRSMSSISSTSESETRSIIARRGISAAGSSSLHCRRQCPPAAGYDGRRHSSMRGAIEIASAATAWSKQET